MLLSLIGFLISLAMYKPRHFKESEFLRCIPPCNVKDMDEGFLYKLDQARDLCEYPFILNSAFRSVDWEKSHGRKGTSSHCNGLAVDLACKSSVVRLYMIRALFQAGFRRIGVYSTFLHVDDDDSKVSAFWIDTNDLTRG